MKKQLLILALLIPMLFSFAQKPNVIVVLADDLGVGDVSHYRRLHSNNIILETPNIDALAAEGMVFTNGHSPAALCAPSRYGVMTGNNLYRSPYPWGVWGSYQESPIKDTDLTLGRLMKTAGYNTAFFGKWHLGGDYYRKNTTQIYRNARNAPELDVDVTKIIDGPQQKGFEYSYTMPAGVQDVPYVVYENSNWVKLKPNSFIDHITQAKMDQIGVKLDKDEGLGDSNWDPHDMGPLLANKAVDYINSNANQTEPFFMYYCAPAVHLPHTPCDQLDGINIKGTTPSAHMDMIKELDVQMGMMIKALKAKGVYNNTVIIFTSDNGGLSWVPGTANSGHKSSSIYRGSKNSQHEGGHRVPFIVSWPSKISAGRSSDAHVIGVDIAATLAGITGTPIAAGQAMDSYDLSPLLLNTPGAGSPNFLLTQSGTTNELILHEEEWKLIIQSNSAGTQRTPEALFNLSNNIEENESQNYVNNSSYQGRKNDMLAKYNNLRDTKVATNVLRGPSAPPVGQSPYGGTNRTIPGTIEAEDYDVGGEGVAYHDTDATNNGGKYRTDGVDIEERDGGTSIGWGAAGEWLEYTVNATAGTYTLEARMAATTNGKTMVVKLDGTTLGTVNVPNTGNWGTFQTVSISNVVVSGGTDKVLRLELVGGGMNLNWVKFTSTGTNVPVTGVSVSPTSESIQVGQTATLTATVAPANASNKKVNWSASNASIATVSNGIVTAISEGTTTITATTDDGNKTATSSITITAAPSGNNFTLGNSSASNAGVDGWKSNLVINETDTYTNNSGSAQQITINQFSFYANKEGDPVTPFVVKVIGDNNFTVLAVGTSRTASAYNVGQNNVAFNDGIAQVISVAHGEKIAVGFLDANANGFGGSTGAVIAWESNAPADQIWYTGGAASTNSGSVAVGSAPTGGANTITTLARNYHFNISITTGASVSVTGINISQSAITIDKGACLDLNETVLPSNATNKTISWSSSNTNIATVSSSGNVCGVNPGTTTITVTTADGGFTKTCAVTVEDVIVPPSNNLLSNFDFETGSLSSWNSWGAASVVANNQHGGTYAVTINGKGAVNQLVTVKANTSYNVSVWGKVAASGHSVSLGAKDHGAAEIFKPITSTTYTQTSLDFTTGATATSARIYFYCANEQHQVWGDDFELIEGAKSAEEFKEKLTKTESLSLYPNPANEFINIDISGNINPGAMIHLIGSSGSIIKSEALHIGYTLELNNLKPGFYIVHVINGSQSLTSKFIKQE